MRSALYYPHTQIRSIPLLKTALLLWDKVEFIVPDPFYRPQYEDDLVAEAVELIGQGHYPSDSEKQEAHGYIEDFVTRPLPEPFYYRSDGMASDYEIYPQKLLYETWQILQQAQFAANPLTNANYPLSETAGLAVMSILADCCAGNTHRRVTDRSAAYATVAGLLAAPSSEGGFLRQPETTHEQLVPITLDIVDAGRTDLCRLVEFRKREEKQDGHALRDLRHRYVDRLESYVTTLTTAKHSDSDQNEIKRQFTDDMKDDLASLRQELKFARNEVLTSKEIITAALAGIGTVAAFAFGAPLTLAGVVTAAGAPVTIGGLLGLRNKYLSSRRSIMQKHPMAYLCELQS